MPDGPGDTGQRAAREGAVRGPATISRGRGTALGLLALLFWASTVGASRIATERLGNLGTAAVVYLAAGVVSCVWAVATSRLRPMLRHPLRYLLGCGGLFALYTLFLFSAIGLPRERQVAIEVGLVNYLWPTAVLLFSVPICGNRPRWLLLPGAILALAGTALGAAEVHGLSLPGLVEHVRENGLAFAGGLAAAVTWGLYSNLTRRWGRPEDPGAVPLFMLATGVLFLPLAIAAGDLARDGPSMEGHDPWTLPAILAVAYLSLFPTVLSCIFWDVAMRTGNLIVVGAASQLTPLVSTAISCAVLGASPGILLGIGAVLVAAGAFICRAGLEEAGGGEAG